MATLAQMEDLKLIIEKMREQLTKAEDEKVQLADQKAQLLNELQQKDLALADLVDKDLEVQAYKSNVDSLTKQLKENTTLLNDKEQTLQDTTQKLHEQEEHWRKESAEWQRAKDNELAQTLKEKQTLEKEARDKQLKVMEMQTVIQHLRTDIQAQTDKAHQTVTELRGELQYKEFKEQTLANEVKRLQKKIDRHHTECNNSTYKRFSTNT